MQVSPHGLPVVQILQHGVGGGVVLVPLWLTFTVCPATVAVPDRAAPPFTAADSVTMPLPLPLDPELTESHDAVALAAQAQPAVVVTDTLKAPPLAGTLGLSGETA